MTPASFTGVWGKIGLCFWVWNPSDTKDHSLTLILNARLQVQDCCKGPRIGCKDRPLLSKQVSDSKVAVGHHMCATCVLLITSDLPVCALEVWGVTGVQNMVVLTYLAWPSHGSAKQCKSTEPSKTGCIAFCFGSVHALNMQACATSTEWLRAISQAFHSHASMHIWQFVALSQPVVIPLPCNVACPRGHCTPDACMRIDFLSQKSMRGWLREPQASQYTTIANWHLELSKWWEMWYHQITINIVIYIIYIDIYIRCFRWRVRLGMLWLAW